MKRTAGFVLAVLMLITVFPFNAFAEGAEIISGSNAFIENKDADSLIIEKTAFEAKDDIDFTVNITVSDCSSDYSNIYLNGQKIAKLNDGLNEISINTGDLLGGENEIKLMLGYASGTYDDSVAYGSVNIDDIAVEAISFSGLAFETPDKINKYMPVEGSAGTKISTVDYAMGQISVGDGWYQETGLGGNTPYNPVAIGFVFTKPEIDGVFVIDTTQLSNGKQTVEFLNNGKSVGTKEYIVDNASPSISFSVNNGTTVSKLDKITYKVDDITSVNSELYVDGKKASSINAKQLSVGSHTAYVEATDAAGNSSNAMLVFNVSEKKYSAQFDEKTVTMSVLGNASVYTGELIKDIRMFENRYGEVNQNYLRSEEEVLVSFDNKADLVTSSIGNSLPYQSFVVNTDGVDEDNVLVSYSGETGNGSGIILKAWNYKEELWDEIASAPSGVSITVSVDLDTYSYKNKMRINAMPDIVYNGSDTILWNSDTQYYSRFDDLNEFYYKICEYTVEQYNAGNVGYYVHTGDLIDQTNVGDEIANKEFQVASNAQKILDDAGVPNGVVAGNHDVLHTVADYSYYYKYFDADRYEDFDWYGGSLNNNMHHYDLVSIGAYDFVFMYLGYYKETDADTIAWANAVCQAYPDRNVIICTHEYLLPSGAYSSDRSQVIWDEIIVPNDNVIMVLCGHNEGVCDQLKQVGNSDRYVLEILADYQFAELGVGPQHVLNDCTCDGEGYVRLMTFNEASQLVSTTYSPVASQYNIDPYNYYPSYSDSFVYDLDMIPADRSIRTTSFNVLVSPEYVGEIGDDDMSLKGCEAFFAEVEYDDVKTYTEIFVLHEYEIDYTPDDTPDYSVAEAEKILVTGYANISENFRINESNEFPTEDYIKVGLNLLPESVESLYQTSGSNIYTKELSKNKGITLAHEYGNNANWVTLANNINKAINVDEYNRIYFGVSAGENAKWNIYVNFQNKTVNFSQDDEIASLFGYVNQAPSDIRGTWSGYIDLGDIIQGNQSVKSIYIVTATPGETVTFDYLFLGKSEGGKVKFVTDENTAIAYEAKIGGTVELPSDPFKQGYIFDGWYTSLDGGTKVETPVPIADTPIEIYARFSEKTISKRYVETYNTEINLEQPSVFKIVFVVGSLLVMATVVVILLLKIKKTSKKRDAKNNN